MANDAEQKISELTNRIKNIQTPELVFLIFLFIYIKKFFRRKTLDLK